MTDLEATMAMFARAGVAATVDLRENDETLIYWEGSSNERPNNQGDYGAGWLVFDRNGALVKIGASES